VVNSIPPFPRHLSPTQRGIESKRIVAAMIAEITAYNPGKTLNTDKMTNAFLGIITMTWHAERIADIERRLDAMDAAPIPAPAKRVKLKLTGGTIG